MPEQVETDTCQGVRNNDDPQGDEYLAKASQLFPLGTSAHIFPSPYRPLIFLILSILAVECFIETVVMVLFPVSLVYHVVLD